MNPAGKVVLCIDDEEPALKLRKLVLESRGFKVQLAQNGEEGSSILDSQDIDAAVVDYSMPGMDGGTVSAEIKRRNPRLPVIMLTAYPAVSGLLPDAVDIFIVKGGDTAALVSKLESLIGLRSHSHPELQREYVVFADSSRRYLDCSDGVCELLGYRRMDLLGLGIEDISYHSERVAELFEQYRNQGEQEGQFVLKHKTGKPVPIRYRAHVFPDGCMAAVWEPIE